jgi:hypothetical protein
MHASAATASTNIQCQRQPIHENTFNFSPPPTNEKTKNKKHPICHIDTQG